MRINARLDEETARKLEYLRRIEGSTLSEVIRMAIEARYDAVRADRPRLLDVMNRAGFIGCAEGPTDLSENTKEALATILRGKHGDR